MKILIAPDKFKGTLTAQEVCEALASGLSKDQKHEIRQLPLADGGEGTQEFFLKHLNGKQITVSVHDPLMRPIQADYILSSDNKTAFIEMSLASGLSLLKENERNPMVTTTFGTGELVQHALDAGVEQIVMGIGGSATNDAGVGLLCSMGARMLDEHDQEFIPRGESIVNIKRIDLSLLHSQAKRLKFIALCDVQNPFFGEKGAAYVYASQKGASPDQIQKLDLGLRHVADLVQQQTGIDLQKIFGSGAGGGIAGGLHVFLNAELTRGIDVVFEITKFRQAVQWADVVITGEGKVDEQTWQGKVVAGVIDQARSLQKRVIIVCGQSTSSSHHQIPILSLSQEFGHEQAIKNPAAALTAIAGKILKQLN